MDRIRLSGRQFLMLHKKIRECFENNCRHLHGATPPTKASQLYGFKPFNPEALSIKFDMEAHQKIKNYLSKVNRGLASNEKGYVEIKGKYLYQKLLEVQNKNAREVTLSPPYSFIYFWYVECKDLFDFQEKFALQSENSYTYNCFYFYSPQQEINEFELKLTFAGLDCEAELNGFHNGKKTDPFYGKGNKINGNYFFSLQNEDQVEIQLILPVEGDSLENEDYSQGILSTISSDNFPLSVRIFLAKKEEPRANASAGSALKISRYLTLLNQTIHLPKKSIRDLDQLRIGRNPITIIQNLVGTYWIWRLYFSEYSTYVAQLKLEIFNDYTARVYHPVYREKMQIGNMQISTIFQDCLCISTYEKSGDEHPQLISFGIVKIPSSPEEKNYLTGSYVTVGNQEDERPYSGQMELYREDDPEHTQLKPELIKVEEVDEFVEKFPELFVLKEELLGMGKPDLPD